MLSILGGCTTRDIFRISKCDDLVRNLWARMTAPSIMADPIQSLLYETEYVPSNFEERQSFIDVNKLFFSQYAAARPEVLLIDFMSEIYGLGSSGDGLVTLAQDTMKRKLVLGVEMQVIPAFGEERLSIMSHSVPALFRRLRDEFGTRIIIHRIYQAERIMDEEGLVANFSDDKVREIRMANKHLQDIYSIIESEFPDISFFNGDANTLLADSSHRWGVSPFHLVPDYSLSALKRLGEQIKLD